LGGAARRLVSTKTFKPAAPFPWNPSKAGALGEAISPNEIGRP
jgi:hypothetical protein